MATDRVSASLSQADYEAILAALATIREKLPFLIGLSAAERKSLPRLGDKSEAFVSKALELAKQNPGFLPRNFDLAEMERDFTLFKMLNHIAMSMQKLDEELADTEAAAGSEAYLAALLVYNYAKTSGQIMSGLDGTLDNLGQRFARKVSKPAAAKESSPSSS